MTDVQDSTTYEPPAITERTMIGDALIGLASGEVIPSATFRAI